MAAVRVVPREEARRGSAVGDEAMSRRPAATTCAPAQVTRSLRRTVQESGARADVSDLLRTTMRHPVTGRRIYLSARDRTSLEKRRAYLEDVRRELGTAAHCPHCGGDLGNNNALRPETIQRDAARAGIGKVSAHTLRHLTATLEAEGGAKAIEIGARLRHRDLQTSEGYIHQRRGAVSHIEPLPLEIPADRPRAKK